MPHFARTLLFALIAFAIVGGTSVQLATSAMAIVPTVMAETPCDMAMSDAGRDKPMAPCKGLTPDCIKQMGCITDVALPARVKTVNLPVLFTTVDYWQVRSDMAGTDRTPDPMPPRTT